MEKQPLTEKQSLELISQMIRNTQTKLEQGSGIPFLCWGYATAIASLIIWAGNLYIAASVQWNWAWFMIPLVGVTGNILATRRTKNAARTYVDRVVSYIWTVFGICGAVVSLCGILHSACGIGIAPVSGNNIFFIIVMLMGAGSAITGFVIDFKTLVWSGLAGILIATFAPLFVHGINSLLVFALIFVIMMIIPGHILNCKSRKVCSEN